MGFQPGNPGRPKGAKNKLPSTAKEALQAAFQRIGDVDGFSAWAAANPDKFYPIWAKLLPTEITGPEGSALVVQVVRLGGEITDLVKK